MDALLENLEDILSNEVQLHEELLAVLLDEAASIGQASPSILLQLQSIKQHISHKIAALETQRAQVVKELAMTWNVGFQTLTLSKIITRVPEERGQHLQQYFNRLKALITEIRPLANKNGALSETRLKPIEMSLRFIHDWQKNQKTYSVAGTLKSSPEKVSRTSA